MAIVNVESDNIDKGTQGFSGKLSLAVEGQSGNTDKGRIGIGTRLQWNKNQNTGFFILKHDYGKTNDVRDTNKTFIHSRYIRNVTAKRAWSLFVQAEQNEFTRLKYRGLYGGGGRFSFISPDKRKQLIIGVGAFRSREELEFRPGTTDAGVVTLWRANLYLSAKYQSKEKVSLVSTSYYQPAFKDSEDYRFLQQLGLVVKLNNKLDLKLSVEVSYDNQPPQTIEKTDTIYSTGIEFRF